MNHQQKSSGPGESAAILLREFREHREQFHVLYDFDDAMSGMRQSVEERLGIVSGPLKTVAERLFKISRDGFFLIQVCELKISYIAEALLHSITVENPLSLASNTRGLIEHLAALMLVVQTMEKLGEALEGQGNESKINESLIKAETMLNRSYYGKSPKSGKKDQTAPHIESECIVALKKHIPEIREMYDFLCEYVHPNYGSNLLVSSGELGRGRLNSHAEIHKNTIEKFCNYCVAAMRFLKNDAIRIAAQFHRLNELVDRCLIPGAKISNAFCRRSATPDGDGGSKDTAFFFPRARTPLEEREMCFIFLQESGLMLTANPEIGAFADDFIYEIYPTNKGKLWFKFKMPDMGF
jgi:hypothetical protein